MTRATRNKFPFDTAAALAGVRSRRIFAYLIDIVILALISLPIWLIFLLLDVLSFGLLQPLLAALLGLIPLTYHTLMLGGPGSATLGMRMLGLQLRTWDGQRPDFLRAFIQTGLFYLSMAVATPLILVVALFTEQKRTLHDLLAGTVVVNRDAVERYLA